MRALPRWIAKIEEVKQGKNGINVEITLTFLGKIYLYWIGLKQILKETKLKEKKNV